MKRILNFSLLKDPIFRYYLNHLDIVGLSESLGIAPNTPREIEEIQDLPSKKYAKTKTIDKNTALKEVFISYSHKDSESFNLLLTHLRPVLRSTRIFVWPETRISGGAIWRDEMARDLYRARVAVLMVSPNFLGSDFIAEHQLPSLLNAAQKDGLVILWVLLSSCLYDETEIKDYQVAHDISKPFTYIA
jgi:hypothetical protein